MKRQTENKIVLVVRSSRLDEMVHRYNTVDQARFCVSQSGADFDDYVREDAVYKTAIIEVEKRLGALGRVQVLKREFLSNFIFGEEDTIVVLGQDGLVANTLKYLDTQPVIGVNPDPSRHDGVLLPFNIDAIEDVVSAQFVGHSTLKTVNMGEVRLSDGQCLYAVNDFFIGARSHVSARYELCHKGTREQQSSSGIIVSTGLGSTGWMKSVLAGAGGILRAFGMDDSPIREMAPTAPDAGYLYYSVREPFPSNITDTGLVFGKIDAAAPLTVTSSMPENGVIFSDGIEDDFLSFNSGVVATVCLAKKAGRLVIG